MFPFHNLVQIESTAEAESRTTQLKEDPSFENPSRPVQRTRWDTGRRSLILAFLFYNAFVVALMTWLYPKNDFGRTFASALNHSKGRPLYAMNESIPWHLEKTTIHLLNLNPPHFHLVLMPFVRLPGRAALAISLIAECACLFVSLSCIKRELGIELKRREAEVWLLAILAFSGTTGWLITGHPAALLVLPVTLGWRAARHGRWGTSGAWFGLAASFKLLLLIVVPYWLITRRWKALGTFFAVVAGCFSSGALVFGTAATQTWLDGTRASTQWASLPLNISIYGVLLRTFRTSLVVQPLTIISEFDVRTLWIIGAGLIGLASLAVAAADHSVRGIDRAHGLLLISAILISPLGWIYYLWLPVAPIVALGWVNTHRPSQSLPETTRTLSPTSRRLFRPALLGLFYPYLLMIGGDRSATISFFIYNIYFYALMMLWVACLCDGLGPLREWFRVHRTNERGVQWLSIWNRSIPTRSR